jgi:hypothetical protein
VTVEPTSAPTRTVSVTAGDDPITVSVPTAIPEDTWTELLAPEYDGNNVTTNDRYVDDYDCANPAPEPCGRLTVTLEANATYDLRLGEVGIAADATDERAVYLTAVDGDDGTYLREAHDPSARDPRTPDQYGGSPLLALERMERVYPWVTENNLGVSASPIGPTFDRVYRFSIPHPHGELETYLDSGSEAVTVEFQRNDLDSLPTETTRTTANGLRLVVETTRGGGPVGVSALDDTTGDPVDATVELGTGDWFEGDYTLSGRLDLTFPELQTG